MHWMDIVNFDPLVARLQELDLQLEELERVSSSGDCDVLGLLDAAESLAGEGFLQCQLYMIERKGDCPASSAYACGPTHNSQHFAQVINTAGNYRKHRGEWPRHQSQWGYHQQNAITVFEDAGVHEDEFRLVRLLEQLSAPGAPRFRALVPKLIAWREAFDQLTQPTVSPTS